MTPYYESSDGAVVLYHGDSRDILPELGPVGAIVTDPPWPGVPGDISGSGSDDAYALFAAVAVEFLRLAPRVVVHLGCSSDPRFLAAMPPEAARRILEGMVTAVLAARDGGAAEKERT